MCVLWEIYPIFIHFLPRSFRIMFRHRWLQDYVWNYATLFGVSAGLSWLVPAISSFQYTGLAFCERIYGQRRRIWMNKIEKNKKQKNKKPTEFYFISINYKLLILFSNFFFYNYYYYWITRNDGVISERIYSVIRIGFVLVEFADLHKVVVRCLCWISEAVWFILSYSQAKFI